MTKRVVIGDRNHRVTICSQKDVVNENGELRLFRKDAFSAWARIKNKYSTRFTSDGAAVGQSDRKITHEIVLPYNPEVLISDAAWLYEARLKSRPRWFKIMEVSDFESYWYFQCQIYEMSDEAIKPATAAPGDGMMRPIGLPDGVRL